MNNKQLPDKCTDCGEGLEDDEKEHNMNCLGEDFDEWICYICETESND